MNKKRNNKLRNFLINDYGLSKELVLEEFKKRVDTLMDKHIENLLKQKISSESIDEQIVFAIVKLMKKEDYSRLENRRTSFEKILKEQIKILFAEEFSNSNEINLKIEINKTTKE